MDEPVNDTIKLADMAKKAIQHPAVIPAVIGVGSGFAGFMLGRRQAFNRCIEFVRAEGEKHVRRQEALRERYEQILRDAGIGSEPEEGPPTAIVISEDIAVRKEIRDRIAADPEAAAEFEEALNSDKPLEMATPTDVEAMDMREPPEDVVRRSLLGNEIGDWDWEKERAERSFGDPYVLHVDEYMEGGDEDGFPQETLTWYAGDSMLVNVMTPQEPMFNASDVLGNFTKKFGHGSGDPSVVYIRNPDRRMEYEVLLHTGLYSVEVVGEDLGPQD